MKKLMWFCSPLAQSCLTFCAGVLAALALISWRFMSLLLLEVGPGKFLLQHHLALFWALKSCSGGWKLEQSCKPSPPPSPASALLGVAGWHCAVGCFFWSSSWSCTFLLSGGYNLAQLPFLHDEKGCCYLQQNWARCAWDEPSVTSRSLGAWESSMDRPGMW